MDANVTAATHTAPNVSQSNCFAGRQFRQILATARTVMAAALHMPKKTWSYAVLDAVDKGNYLAKAKIIKYEKAPTPSSTENAQRQKYTIQVTSTIENTRQNS